ncbi:hypothetical protein [Sorangium atrum]|uniref:Uncharacterized protein n=1 Tax=Sorangium atrum TaxID=2995308 RepID=A0ABT5C6A4_9BACT|nr:hypothetical protein [Sorangium aterium]MDC0681188.1 hypothetical protein [Sorangium aterium]
MNQVNANTSPAPDVVARGASGGDAAQRGSARAAAGARGLREPGRGS